MNLVREPIVVRRALRAWSRARPRTLAGGARLRASDWARLVVRARSEGVAGLIHNAVHTDPAAEAPSSARKALRATAMAQAAVAAREERVLAEVLDALAARSVRPVLLRGLGLVASLYQDGSQRAQVDHDLLVRPFQRDSARAALRELGFRASPGGGGPYLREASVIDLHTDPYDRERAPYRTRLVRACADAVHDGARWAEVAGRPVQTPCPADRLLTVSAHLVKHSFDRLIRLVDVAECWRAGGFDPEDLLRRARGEGTAEALYYASAAAFVLLDAEIPLGWLAHAHPTRRPIVERGFRRVLAGRPAPFFEELLALSRLGGLLPRAHAIWQMLWPAELQSRARALPVRSRLAFAPARLGWIAGRVTRR